MEGFGLSAVCAGSGSADPATSAAARKAAVRIMLCYWARRADDGPLVFAASLQKLPRRLLPSGDSCHRKVPLLVRVEPCSVKVRTTDDPSMRPVMLMGVRADAG